MIIITLAQAMDSAATAVHMDRKKADAQFGSGLFDLAVEHHKRQKLKANITQGTTRNRDGINSRFLQWGPDNAKIYEDAPHFVWFDFFRPFIMNSCSRLSRGFPA